MAIGLAPTGWAQHGVGLSEAPNSEPYPVVKACISLRSKSSVERDVDNHKGALVQGALEART
jgi:hypothetical protein